MGDGVMRWGIVARVFKPGRLVCFDLELGYKGNSRGAQTEFRSDTRKKHFAREKHGTPRKTGTRTRLALTLILVLAKNK